MKEIIQCPLCSENIYCEAMYGNILENKEFTYAWICQHCPFVSFEFYKNKDIDNLIARLMSKAKYKRYEK
jgi:C4-type Zn-finger protein